MDNWNEIRTAAYVARLGTISAAAASLGVHRATVNRHIDALEAFLGAKLFQRHARGFVPTELGLELRRIAEATDAQFGELQRLARGQSADLGGEFVVTSVDVLSPLVLPPLNAFQALYPKVKTRYVANDRTLKLAYGEADIAFRIGPKPADPDNVVLPFGQLDMGLYAAAAYAQQHGLPRSRADYHHHRFVGPDTSTPRAPFIQWIEANIPDHCITFTGNAISLLWSAVLAGSGIGFLPTMIAQNQPELHEVIAPRPEWQEPLWTVTHADLHRSAKVQAFFEVLRSRP